MRCALRFGRKFRDQNALITKRQRQRLVTTTNTTRYVARARSATSSINRACYVYRQHVCDRVMLFSCGSFDKFTCNCRRSQMWISLSLVRYVRVGPLDIWSPRARKWATTCQNISYSSLIHIIHNYIFISTLYLARRISHAQTSRAPSTHQKSWPAKSMRLRAAVCKRA